MESGMVKKGVDMGPRSARMGWMPLPITNLRSMASYQCFGGAGVGAIPITGTLSTCVRGLTGRALSLIIGSGRPANLLAHIVGFPFRTAGLPAVSTLKNRGSHNHA